MDEFRSVGVVASGKHRIGVGDLVERPLELLGEITLGQAHTQLTILVCHPGITGAPTLAALLHQLIGYRHSVAVCQR